MDTHRIIEHITQWLNDYAHNAQSNGFIVGISGGIDSAVTSTLCARTNLPVWAVTMPIHQAENQVDRAEEHLQWLTDHFSNVQRLKLDLTTTFDAFTAAVNPEESNVRKDLALANTRARFRMSALYYYATLHGALVAGTGNKVEDFGVGFYTKYGDGGVDLSPIADLMKTEVFALARALNIVESIQTAAPTDGLWNDDRTDEDQLGATYAELEWAMKHLENSEGNLNDASLTDRQKTVLGIYQRFHSANLHKMKPIPVCIIPLEYK